MKATGVIRRIDELGRIVIPKELRKNLRIKEGENIEIYTNDNESIVLKKFSSLKNINDLADNIVYTIYSNTKINTLLFDNDTVIAYSGKTKKDYIYKTLGSSLVELINGKKNKLNNVSEVIEIVSGKKDDVRYNLNLIKQNGDVIGGILLFSNEYDLDNTRLLLDSFSNFLEKYIEY